MPQIFFLSERNRYFSFMKILWKNSENSCSVVAKNFTLHMATLSKGIKGYIEIPTTTVKPSHYRINDIFTLSPSVAPTYQTEITEPIIVQYEDMKQINSCFEIKDNDLHEDATLNNTVCNVQPPQKLAPRVYPLLPYCKEISQFLTKVQFQCSDLTDSE